MMYEIIVMTLSRNGTVDCTIGMRSVFVVVVLSQSQSQNQRWNEALARDRGYLCMSAL